MLWLFLATSDDDHHATMTIPKKQAHDPSSAMASNSNDAADKNLAKVFELLHEGKELQSNGDLWNAANTFVQARAMLQALSNEQPKTTEEEQQIAKLYEQQAREYLHTSRQCLIEAMKLEKEKDETEEPETPFFSTLSNEQAETRIRTFYSLFSGGVKIMQDTEDNQPKESSIDQQWTLEERLMELNASLPSGFKTSEERMR
jgi:hypothetical protein